jgi:hypothetical protein
MSVLFHVSVLLSINYDFGRLEIVLQFASECAMMKMYDIRVVIQITRLVLTAVSFRDTV